MLFPENKALFGDDEKRGHFVTNGVDLHVKLYLLITLQIFEKQLGGILGKTQGEILKLTSTIDHVEEGRITWLEFMTWLIKEGRVRDVANDQRLFTFTLARIQEKAFFKIGQYNISKISSIDVEHPSGKVQHLCITVMDESRHVQIYDEENLQQSLYTFNF